MTSNIKTNFHDRMFWRKAGVLGLFGINLVIIIWIWITQSSAYISDGSFPYTLIALGRLSGLLAAFLLLTQLMLIGRVRWFEHLFGFDKLDKFHRWIGYSILSLVFAHPIFLVWANSGLNGFGFFEQLGFYLANKEDVLWAFLAVLMLCYIVFLSIAGVRRRVNYETWYLIHLGNYFAIGLAMLHQFDSGDLALGFAHYYWYALSFGVLGLVMVYRFLRPVYLFYKYRFQIAQVVKESHDVTSIYITGQNIGDFKYQAGQYANLNFLDWNRKSKHPFSFSTSRNTDYIRFSIKSSGDFTNTMPGIKPGTWVIMDGPLGLFISETAYRDKFLMIAGGIGITPLRALVEELGQQQADIVLLYAVKSTQDMVFKEEFEACQKINPNLKIHYILGQPEPGYETGFVDKEKIQRLVSDFNTRDTFLCGPPPMMKAVSKTLMGMGVSKKFIHFEKFSF